MKNFTKQNFKTNPLWIRLLIMAFMLLAGAGNVWAGMWVNDSKGWNIQIEKNGSTDWLSSKGFNREDKNGSYKDYTSTELKSFSIKKAWIKASSNDNWQIRYAAIYCRVSKNQTGNFTQKKCKDYGSNVSNASSAYFELDVNYDILNGLEPGTYYLDYYFGIGNDGCDKPYCYAPEYNCNGTNPYCSNCQNCSFYTIKFTVPQPDACVGDRYIAGSSSVFGSEWDPDDSNNKMSCDNTTGYSKTYITNFTTRTTIEFKITDGSWDNSWGDNGSNYKHTVDVGCRSVTIKFNGTTNKISVEEEASNACCSAPSGVSIDEAPSTKLCPGDQVTLKASIGAGDVDSYKWSVSGDGWSIKSGETANSCTFTVGTATGKISLKVNGCNTDVLATDKSIQVKSKLTESDYTVQASASWNSSGTTPRITPNSGKPTPKTVKYKFNSTTATASTSIPKDVGTYYVYITTDATTDYCAATDLYIGEFKIEKANQSTLSISTSNDNPICGNELTLSTTGGSGDGIVTYEIVSGGTASNASISGNKLTVGGFGTVKVKAKKAGNSNYNEIYSDIKTFTFETPATLSWDKPAKGFLVAGETITAKLEPAAAGTITYDTSDNTVIGISNGKLTAQPNKNGTADITATPILGNGYCEATAITESNVPVKFFNVAGTENLCGDAWNTTANPMTYNNGVWSKTFKAKPADVYEFQISREEWDGNWEDRKKIYSGEGNITCKEIHRTDGGNWYNIEFTTPTKGNITIKFTEGKGSYVEFEPICITEDDVTAGAISVGQISADKDQYNYNETAKLSIADAIIDAAYGTEYSISYQWQEKNGDEYTDIQGATGKTYTTTNLTVGTHTYKVVVTYSYTDLGANCTGTVSAEKEIEVICPAPAKPTVNVISHTTKCKDDITKGKVEITNYDPDCLYYMGQNESPFNVTVEDNKAYIYFELEDTNSTTYTIRAKSKCGTNSAQSEYSDSSEQFTVNYTDNTPTVKVSILGGNSICAGETTTLTANISDLKGTITSYVWSPEGGIINDNTYTTPALNETKSFIVRLNVVNEGCEKEFTATEYKVTVNPIPTVTLGLSNVGICKGEAINADLNFLAIPEVTNGVAVWYDSETGGNVITQANLEKAGTYWVAAENSETGCKSPKREKFTTVINDLPKYPELGKTSDSVCQDNAVVDLGKLANVDAVVWYQNGEEVEKPNQISIADTGEFKYLAKAVDPNTGCKSAEGVEFTLTVNPTPAITLSADNETVNVGETVTLSVAGSDFTSLTWSATDGTKSYTVTPGPNNTATITTDENALITVTVEAKSDAGCETSASIDLTFGSEDCENANADYIEILCRNITTSSKPTRDMYCYAWDPITDKTYLGGWPGVKTDEGDFEYKGNKYAVWQVKTNTDLSIIFNNNSGRQTDDISGLKKGYRYVYEIKESTTDGNKYTYELKEESIIFAPEVKTLCATYARQSDNTLKVTVTGKIMKKGCASITSYGFQQIYNNVYTNIEVGTTNQDAGFIFTKDITLEAGKYGEYTFRARLINENSSKVYGEKITIYYSESDVLIAAVGDDEIVTNKSGVYYDFVGLYVKNVMLPEGAKVKSYQWYKGDALYNGGKVTVADRGVSAANNNIRPSEAGAYKCVVTLDNNTTLTSNVINVEATDTYNDKVNASNRNLPVISVRTNVAFPTCATAGTEGKYPSTNIEGWKEKRSVDVKIFNADGTLYYDRKARMNYRGSSSLNFNKKSYAFCPGAANCGGKNGADYVKKEALNLFGLSKGAIDEDWVLYAAAADPTLMRNRLVFDTYAKMTGEWGVNSMFVELVIDGEYQGVYVLMDKITNNEKRVYVGTYGDDEKKDYSGGFIVKFDKTDVADRERNLVAGQEIGDEKTFRTVRTGRTDVYTYGTYVDQLFEIEYPEKEDVEDAGASWSTTLNAIKQRFQDFEDALEKGEFLKVRAMIDYESWADWFIINEFTKNLDAYRASCVFTCKGEGQKIKALPLWDQELSFNNGAANNAGKGADKTNGLLIENDGVYKDCFPAPFWFTGRVAYFNNCGVDGGESSENPRLEYYLLKDECFIQTIKDRWAKHIAEGGPLHNKTLTDKVDVLLSELGAAKSRETTKWPSDHRVNAACGGGLDTGYKKVGFDASKTALVNWVGGTLNANATSESSSNSRVTNLNYLINKMQGDPLQFNLVLNPGNGVTTPWVPVTLTVEAPAGYDYTYDDSEVEAAEGVIIKKLGNDAFSYTFPRPEAWGTGNDTNASDPRDPRQYGVKVTLNVETIDNTCGTVDTEKHATITLEDEGDDNCSYTNQ